MNLGVSLLRSCHTFSLSFRSRYWLGHSITWNCFDLNQVSATADQSSSSIVLQLLDASTHLYQKAELSPWHVHKFCKGVVINHSFETGVLEQGSSQKLQDRGAWGLELLTPDRSHYIVAVVYGLQEQHLQPSLKCFVASNTFSSRIVLYLPPSAFPSIATLLAFDMQQVCEDKN